MKNSRVRRRNAIGYKGSGTTAWTKTNDFGDYTNQDQNHKRLHYIQAEAKKQKLGYEGAKVQYEFDAKGNLTYKFIAVPSCLNKRYANHRQKVRL